MRIFASPRQEMLLSSQADVELDCFAALAKTEMKRSIATDSFSTIVLAKRNTLRPSNASMVTHTRMACLPMLDKAISTRFAMSGNGTTSSTAPTAIASLGMPNTTQLASS